MILHDKVLSLALPCRRCIMVAMVDNSSSAIKTLRFRIGASLSQGPCVSSTSVVLVR